MDLNQRGYVHKKAGLAIKIIVLICALVVYMFPFVMVIINSFKIKRDIIKEPMALIGSHGASLDNYVEFYQSILEFSLHYRCQCCADHYYICDVCISVCQNGL